MSLPVSRSERSKSLYFEYRGTCIRSISSFFLPVESFEPAPVQQYKFHGIQVKHEADSAVSLCE